MGQLATKYYTPLKEFLTLNDYKPFDSVSAVNYKNIIEELKILSLDKVKRVLFYYIGSGEAILLDRINPGWRSRYFTEKFYLEKYFQ